MASRHKPRMSLPPELSAIDDAWGEEEQTTLPRPSRMPTAPARPDIPEVILTGPPPTGIEIEDIEQPDDPQRRATKVPKKPLDDYAREMMTNEAQQAITEAPPRGDGSSLELELDLSFSADLQFSENEKSTAVRPPSQYPTAPPPMDFDAERQRTLPQGPGTAGMEFDFQSEMPPPLSPATAPRTRAEQNPHQLMKDKFAMGDFSGALDVAEQILNQSPHDPEARSLSEKCRDVLLDMYSSKISGLDRVPQIVMTPDQIRWLSLDHRAGFLLSMVDGISSVDDLLDVSGMRRLDALRILCSLLDQKVIHLS